MLVSVGVIGARCGRERATAGAATDARPTPRYRMTKGKNSEVPRDRPPARCRAARIVRRQGSHRPTVERCTAIRFRTRRRPAPATIPGGVALPPGRPRHIAPCACDQKNPSASAW
ncbi:hypothetical protein [Burkholderia diffusa]|uniref:hypothetical protein n=1 Tax=Burkholderia diffusa TaxID=488732 RepID=UPI0012D909D6|nr:hypothetical protein [Burkholderia diffusa]